MMVQNKNNIEPSRGCTVARNKVQFQKGLSEVEFERLYGTEELCRATLEKWRWPNGFVCPALALKTWFRAMDYSSPRMGFGADSANALQPAKIG